jgi:twitching motility protein PilT
MRVHGELQLSSLAKLSSDDIQEMIYSIMTKEQISRYEDTRELDFAIQYDSTNRFRINLHQQRGYMEATMRLISTRLLSMENLNIPDVVKDLSKLKEGLILVTGPTGAGKTTTMAVMVELINRDRKGVIVTLERPIEYVHPNIKCIVKQREIGIDTDSFSVALKSSLRQDPNVIVVGELDDIETIRTAIIAAEAGYLVIASFHAPNSVQALDRLAAMFPIDNRRQIMFQLANCLKGVIAQILIPRKDRSGRVLATELVIVNDAVRRVLRDDDLVQLPTIIQTGSAHKMQSMVVAIKKYFEDGLIDSDAANFYSEEFTRYGR